MKYWRVIPGYGSNDAFYVHCKTQPGFQPLASRSHEMFHQYIQQLLAFQANSPLNPSIHADQDKQFPIVEPSKIRWCGLLYTYWHQMSVIVRCKSDTGGTKQESVKDSLNIPNLLSGILMDTSSSSSSKERKLSRHKIQNSKGLDSRLLKTSLHVHTKIPFNSFTSNRVLLSNIKCGRGILVSLWTFW